MGLVCEELVRDNNLQALSRLHATSSAIYTVVTPYFYRHLRLNQYMAVELFRLFSKYSKSDNNRFLQLIPEDVHLVDMHPALRSRQFFSHITTFSLFLREDLELWSEDYDMELDRYKELMFGLSAFGGPPLWPALARCDVSMGSSQDEHEGRDSDNENEPYDSFDWKGDQRRQTILPSEYFQLFEILFARLHPEFMAIDLPEHYDQDDIRIWNTALRRLRADTIDVRDYSANLDNRLPRASSTLVLRHEDWGNEAENRLDKTIDATFMDVDALIEIERIKLVGLLPRGKGRKRHGHLLESVTFERIERHIPDIRESRGEEGNKKDLMVGIMPDTTPEGEAAAVWRTYKQPERKGGELLSLSDR